MELRCNRPWAAAFIGEQVLISSPSWVSRSSLSDKTTECVCMEPLVVSKSPRTVSFLLFPYITPSFLSRDQPVM